MKTKLLIIAVVAILVSACTTGTKLARTYDDDIYFSPADVPPVSMVQDEAPVREKPSRSNNSNSGNQRIVMSQMEKNADGTSTLNNYIYQPEDSTKNSDYQSYNMDQQNLDESDTTVYYNDDSVKYVINNYYDDNDNNDLDFTYRINRFHRPYYYDPFIYDDWNYGGYSPYYSGYNNWGYNSWYGGYGGWGYPYSYGYYSPFSFGFGSYLGYGGYGYGYGGYYGGGYYGGGYYGGGYYGGGGYYNDRQVARRRSTNMNLPGGGLTNNTPNTNRTSNMKSGLLGNSSDQRLPNGATSNTWVQNGHLRSRSIDPSANNQNTKNATIVNSRRSSNITTGSQVQNNNSRYQIARPNTSTSGNIRRSYAPSTTGRTYNQNQVVRQSQNYTPSYNKPRIVNQSSYNNNSSTYTRPRTSSGSYQQQSTMRSSTSGGQTYSEPRSSSTMRQTYRSSSSYSSGSSNSSNRSSTPSSGSTYSAPERSSGSYSSGGGSYNSGSSSGGSSGSSSGSSSGGSSGGGGGSGHRR